MVSDGGVKKEFTCGVMTHKVYVDAACHLTDIFFWSTLILLIDFETKNIEVQMRC